MIALLPQRRQNLLFSATFPDDIRSLANKLLREPVSVEVGQRNAAADEIEQAVYFADKGQKRGAAVMAHRLWQLAPGARLHAHQARREPPGRATRRRRLDAAAIHGNKSQGARTRALADFKHGAVRVLVATDIAARGLDIDQLPHVVNYDLPEVPEHYVHRIGRTGRAGNEGLAISLVERDERPLLKPVERLLGLTLPRAAARRPPHAEPSSGRKPQRHDQRPHATGRKQRRGTTAVMGTAAQRRRRGQASATAARHQTQARGAQEQRRGNQR